MLKTLSAAIALTTLSAGSALAATVSFSSVLSTGAANPLATSTSGDVLENTSGSIYQYKRSPFELGDPADDDFVYTVVNVDSTAMYDFEEDSTTLSFIWGSPDDYNLLTFYNDGVATGETLVFDHAGVNMADPLANITTALAFDSVMFSSSGIAFEFAGLQNSLVTIPLPAAGLMLVAGLGPLGLGRRRRAA